MSKSGNREDEDIDADVPSPYCYSCGACGEEGCCPPKYKINLLILYLRK